MPGEFEALSQKFETASQKIAEIISHSKTVEDPVHSVNAREWLVKLRPDADEILQLAILGHDIERALPNRLTKEQFESYDAYKSAHAKLAGEVLAKITKDAGYSENDAERIRALVAEAEASSHDPDIQLISDADSLSYFDYNVNFYFKRNGVQKTKDKIWFMYERCSPVAKKEIEKLMEQNEKISPIFKEAIHDNSK